MMTEVFNLPPVDDEYEWIDYLANYQKKLVNQLLEKHTIEELGSIWVDSTMDTNSPFSTKPNNNKYYRSVLNEIKKFICGDDKYQKERNNLIEAGKSSIVTGVANAVATTLGLPAELIAPAVVATFISISKISSSAWCEMNTLE